MSAAPALRTAARRLREDTGTITILLVGVVAVVLMVIGVGAAITGVHLDRTQLQHTADGAALAAAQAVETDAFYREEGAPVVTERSARVAARDHLEQHARLAPAISDVAIDRLDVGGDGTVRVTVTARTRPPLIGWFMRGSGSGIPLTVVGEAHAS